MIRKAVSNTISASKVLIVSLGLSIIILVSGGVLAAGIKMFLPNSEQQEQRTLVRVRDSVVKLSNHLGTSGGTGVEVKGDLGKPFILTNFHVCDGYLNSTMLATTPRDKHIVRVLHVDPAHDLCLTTSAGGKALPFSGDLPKYYDMVYSVGHPLLNVATPSVGRLIGRAIIKIASHANEKGECPPDHEVVEDLFATYCVAPEELDMTTNVIYPGSSGSPAFNKSGELIGLFNSGDGRTNYGNLVPLEFIKEFLKNK